MKITKYDSLKHDTIKHDTLKINMTSYNSQILYRERMWLFHDVGLRNTGGLMDFCPLPVMRGSSPKYTTTDRLKDDLSLRSGIRSAEHKRCNWGMQMIDGCSLEQCVAKLAMASYLTSRQRNKINSHSFLVIWLIRKYQFKFHCVVLHSILLHFIAFY